MSADLADTISQLAELWPALAAALARDTTTNDGGTTGFTAATVVNADVLAAMVTLERDVPTTTRAACDAISEPWQHRALDECLRQIPRLASRMHDLGHDGIWLDDQVSAWLRTTKRALGLRKPDVRLRYACPWADSYPENHADASALILVGAEGFIRHDPEGDRVDWVLAGQIYCSSRRCSARWSEAEWPLLERMLETAGAA